MMPAPAPQYRHIRGLRKCDGLDIAMGGSTNTVLHLLAASYEGEVGFTMEDIDRLSRKVPCLSKVAPAKSDVHMEDVHRAVDHGNLGRIGSCGIDPSRHQNRARTNNGRCIGQLGCHADTTPTCMIFIVLHRVAFARHKLLAIQQIHHT